MNVSVPLLTQKEEVIKNVTGSILKFVVPATRKGDVSPICPKIPNQ
jgi:hypothetical protein